MSTDAQFASRAESTLTALADAVEDADADALFDVDYQEGVLTLVYTSGATYVINKHTASGKIWMSSPVSGAHYFVYDDAAQRWKEGATALEPLLAEELKTLAGIQIPV